METKNNSKSSFRVKLVWFGLTLTILFFVLQQANVLDWPVWPTFLPFIVALIVFVSPYIIGFLYIRSQKSVLRSICEKMVQNIQAADESNVAESVNFCLENAKLIEENRDVFRGIPASGNNFVKSVMGPVSFLAKNKEFKEKLEGLTDAWTEKQKQATMSLLKSHREMYSNLWF